MPNKNKNKHLFGLYFNVSQINNLVLLRISLSYSHARYWARTIKSGWYSFLQYCLSTIIFKYLQFQNTILIQSHLREAASSSKNNKFMVCGKSHTKLLTFHKLHSHAVGCHAMV